MSRMRAYCRQPESPPPAPRGAGERAGQVPARRDVLPRHEGHSGSEGHPGRPAAGDGDADAQKMLGDIYSGRESSDTGPDYELAAKWYREAAGNGNADAGECLRTLQREGKILL